MQFLVGLMLTAALTAMQPQSSPAPDPTAFHVVLLRVGPRWAKDAPASRQPGIQDHGQYMSRLSKEGRVVLGGPFLDDAATGTVSGAMVILATPEAAEARRLMEADPGVKSGLLEIVEVRRLMVAVGSWRPW